MTRSVTPGMKLCPYCAEEIRAEAIKCRYCGEKLKIVAEPARAAVPTKAPEAPAPETAESGGSPPHETAAEPSPASGFQAGALPASIYRPDFDVDTLPVAVRDQARRHSFNRRVPVPLAIAASLLTGNLFFAFNYAVKHGRLPKLTSNDPGPVMSALLLFVPFVNLYWVYFVWVRLADRLNLQLRLRGEDPRIRRSLPITAVTLMLVGFLTSVAVPELMSFAFAINWFVLVPLFVADLQSVINQLVDEEQPRS